MTSVILVDEQAMIRAGLRGILEDAGIEVLAEAADGRQGLEAIRRTPPDVVLMDLRMPVMDGVGAVRRLRADEATRRVPVLVLVLTTFDGDRDVVDALGAGADGFLGKTAEPEELISTITAVARGDAALSHPCRTRRHHPPRGRRTHTSCPREARGWEPPECSMRLEAPE